MKSALRTIAINAFVAFVVISAITWIVCFANAIHSAVKESVLATTIRAPSRSKLPNYANIDWARRHFTEFDSLGSKYVSYIGWRRRAYSGETITVSGPYLQRRTVARADPKKPTVYFFGGSTMWGTGSNDESTIPSLFSQLSGLPAENFGESAYTAHQSLILLIQLLQDGHRPEIVVFYDGANEVLHKCRAELGAWSHAREAKIAAALQRKLDLTYLLWPMQDLAQGVVEIFGGDKGKHYDCGTDKQKAQKIADNLLRDWAVARQLVQSYKGRFVGILQPVSYFSDTKLAHLRLSPALKEQFQAVYPLIESEMKNQGDLHSLVGALDRDEYIYVDFCHLSPNGNGYVAEKILKIVAGDRARSLTGHWTR